ncbi:MAG: hypothetical protein OEX04_02005 [Acidimicrobiia bacterium]|nr:hypothetical protein [Acidimicrobiia bacterium]MDH4306230.1 hypothetical protein [Acidimicrobiia bacterium]MDH5293196.1 hypothetical protein [Acidimicrobiia bacterium]
MKTKKYLYAAVGAPVAVAKTAQSKVDHLRSKMNDGRESMSKDFQSQLDEWAKEGERFVGKIGDSKAIDEITDRVDFDQVQTQVSKLRDQLEDLLDTWRTNFRPAAKNGKISEKVEVSAPASEKPAAKTTAAKKPAARTTAAKTTAAKKPAAKKPATRTTAAKKPAAKTTAAKAS